MMRSFLTTLPAAIVLSASLLTCTSGSYPPLVPIYPLVEIHLPSAESIMVAASLLVGGETSQQVIDEPPPAPAVEPEPPAPLPNRRDLPAPWKKRALSGQAPIIKITAPPTVEIGHLAMVVVEASGGPCREIETTIAPAPADGDLVYGSKEVLDPDGDPVQIEDRQRIYFVGPPGIYTVTTVATGEERGFCKAEAVVRVRDSRPPVAKAEPTGPQSPQIVIAKFAAAVPSPNLEADKRVISRAAYETAKQVRDGIVDPARLTEEFQNRAYQLMANALRPWNEPSYEGRSFFDNLERLRDDAAKSDAQQFDPANFLEYVGQVLSAK